MSGVLVFVLIFFGLVGGLGTVAYFTYQHKLRRAKAIERGLKMVPILIHLPPPSSDTAGQNRDVREVMREKTAQAEVLYNMIAGTAVEGFKSTFYGQRHVAFELISIDGVVHYFAAVPVAMVSVVTKAVQTAYPGARVEEVEDHNIFNQEGRLAATLGGEMVLREESAYPIATYEQLERDPMEAILTTMTGLEKKDGAAVQIMLRPAGTSWTKRAIQLANLRRRTGNSGISFSAMDVAKAAIKAPQQRREELRDVVGHTSAHEPSQVDVQIAEKIEGKLKHPGFEVLVRVIVSTGSVQRSQQLLRDIATAFALFDAAGSNGFKFLPAMDVQGLVTAFIFRFFPPEIRSNVLNSAELATLFHFPDSQFTPSASVERQKSKQVDGPVQLSSSGLLFGHNDFRGVQKEIRLSPEDRRRHTYILGQTGTGKSTLLENLAVQDMKAGNGFAFIDPHGDSAERLLAMVPKERAEDIVYFNPADTEYPLGLNLFEFTDPSQKDFLVQETINMLYKLYDPGKTGIIGPRYEHWYRNAALTLMADPNGATFIEIPKVFTDTDYLKTKFKYLRDPTVIDFWTKEMGQTSDYHKSEMLGWFVSKFGAFQNNEMMRNILGQPKSAFNLRDIMDKRKLLIVNLSKGRVGELNSQLLGMIFVIKFQAAAMSRADMAEAERADFSLYVDEFQNFSTESFATILSEARKYRLNLIVANQFIGQLSDQVREAVFGNIGTIVAHRMGPDDAEYMVKQFAPVFDTADLVNIPNFNAAMRLMIGGLPSQPFTLRDLAPLGAPNLELGEAVKQLSAAKFGKPRAEVEATILDRFSARPAPALQQAPVVAAPVAPGDAGGAPPATSSSAAAVTPAAAQGIAPAPVPAAAVPATAAAPAAVAVVPAAAASAVGPTPMVAPQPGYAPAAAPASPAPRPQPEPAPQPALVSQADAPAEIGQVLSESGFADMDASVGGGAQPSPQPAQAVSAQAFQAQPLAPLPMLKNPPPIGAPPVELPPLAQGPAVPAQPMPLPAPVISGPQAVQQAVVRAPAPAPLNYAINAAPAQNASVQPAPLQPPAQAAPLAPAVAAPIVQTAVPVSGIAPAGVAMTPPPIGAPPVDLPLVGVAPAAAPIQQVGAAPATLTAQAIPPVGAGGASTLTVADITGGRPPAPKVLDLASVPIMTPGTEPPPVAMQAAPLNETQAMQSAEQAPVEEAAPLGSGMPLEGDPYAGIDVLGDLTPPGSPVATREDAQDSGAALVDKGSASGAPLPDDPYAGIDVLAGGGGQEELPVPPDAQIATEAQAPVQAQAPAELNMSEATDAPSPVAPPLPPKPRMRRGREARRARAAALAPTTGLPVAAPALMAPMPPQPAPAQPAPPAPMPTVDPAAVAAPAPIATPVPVVQAPSLPQMPIATTPQPLAQVSPPQPVPAVATTPEPVPVAQPESVAQAPEPELEPTRSEEPLEAAAAALPTPHGSAEPALFAEPSNDASLAPSEPLIHFVDPGAEQVLQRTDVPEAVVTEPDDLAAGLPEGVHLLKTGEAPPVQSANAPVPATTQAAPTQAASAAPQPPAVPVVSAQALKPAPMAIPGSPPPIGAPPVDLPVVAPTPAGAPPPPAPAPVVPEPAPVPPPPPPAITPAPVPQPNATLAKALQAAPPTPGPAAASFENVQSVAQTLKNRVAAAPAPTETETKPQDQGSSANVEQPASGQIENAEHEIDELLSQSLIHPDNTATHRRLPEPVEPQRRADESGIDLEMNTGRPPEQPAAVAPEHAAEHHGLKVIQPLEPIVPAKEKFAKEIAAINQPAAAQAAPPATPSKHLFRLPLAGKFAKRAAQTPAPTQQTPPPPAAKVVAPPVPAPATAVNPPKAVQAPPPAIVKHDGELLPEPPKPIQALAQTADDEGGLPQAESLAANDVAKARAEREATVKLQQAEPATDKPVTTGRPEDSGKHEPAKSADQAKPEGTHKTIQAADTKPVEATEKGKPAKQGKPLERVGSEAEAEHNKPSEAEAEHGKLTGKLILPTGEKPKQEPVAPRQEKPKKLAPGEVFVDASGNVSVGE